MSQADTSQFIVNNDALELAQLLDPFDPELRAKARISPHPSLPALVNEGDDGGGGGDDGGSGSGTGDDGGNGGSGSGAAAGGGKNDDAPWGDDANFNADQAKKLITNLRDDKKKQQADLDEFRKKLQEHEDSKKSDSQKLTERAETAETRATKAEAEAARLRVALRKGLSETQAKRLVGDSEDDLEKDAEELLESFKNDDEGGQDSQRRPKERLRPGAAPGNEPEETDPRKLASQVSRDY